MTTPEMSLAAQRLREGGRDSWQQDSSSGPVSSQSLPTHLPPLIMPQIRGADTLSSSQRITSSPARPPSRPLHDQDPHQQEQDCRAIIEKMRNIVYEIVRKEEIAIGDSRVKHIKRSNDLHLYKASIEHRKTRLNEIMENNKSLGDTQELIYAEMTHMGAAELSLSNASETIKQRLQAASDWLAVLTSELHHVADRNQGHGQVYERKVEDHDRRLSIASTPSRTQERMDRLNKQIEGERMQLKQERDAVKQEKERDLELKKRWEHEMTEEKARFRREKNDLQMELQKVQREKDVIEIERNKLSDEISQLRAEMEHLSGEMDKSTACNEGHVSRLRSFESSGSTLIDSLYLRLLDQLKDAADKEAKPEDVLTRQQRALSTSIDIIEASFRKQNSTTEVSSSEISLPPTSHPTTEQVQPPKQTPIPIIHIKKRGRPSNATKLAQQQREKENAASNLSVDMGDDDETTIKRRRRPKVMSPDEGYENSNDDDGW